MRALPLALPSFLPMIAFGSSRCIAEGIAGFGNDLAARCFAVQGYPGRLDRSHSAIVILVNGAPRQSEFGFLPQTYARAQFATAPMPR